ncbi:hypothetical protein AAJ72_08420 [Citromicrobium sp. RCC1885]|uniref:hypothetical protein n=1 Tax=unclassified Citromicrobium TaxID=2630544 RepID=UPI0006C91CCC|nr:MULTISPECIES: hypothetical protein [unclassified Citromicrobium]KPM25639.1 hypothetical protein AAJ72_08420 [Citromicrobium sp. RCC1885]KPM28881.1 hypothetical protein AAJ74_09160 [Citromicrobium sp. RCC1878]OAM09567.1 hypothetical protein A0U43_00270 [Citromicrobium sp. RCC1897]|tara:strand:- start:7413 stop:7667 length:255 start_codon:yes stop_codon:yes gene_type:complete
MHLPYDEYRSDYEGLGYSEEGALNHLNYFARFLDYFVRAAWEKASLEQTLGIAGVSDSVRSNRVVEWKQSLPDAFNARSGGRKS